MIIKRKLNEQSKNILNSLKELFLKGVLVCFLLIFSFLTLSFSNLNNVQAQSLELGLYPPLLEVMIKPGKSITQVYKVINNSDVDLILKSQIIPFQAADDLGGIELLENQNQSLGSDWFSFQNADLELGDQFILKAQEDQQVVLKIKVPENAPEDDYYFTLLFESQTEPILGFSASQAQIKIGANVLLTVSESGEPLKKAEIVEFSLANPLFKIGSYLFIDSFSQPKFNLKIKNIGRTLFKPMGTITIASWSKQSYVLDILPENVITKSSRQLRCFSTNNNQPINCVLTPNWQTKLLIGNYQAVTHFGLDKISQDYQTEVNFMALPFSFLGIILFLVVIIVFFNRFLKFFSKK